MDATEDLDQAIEFFRTFEKISNSTLNVFQYDDNGEITGFASFSTIDKAERWMDKLQKEKNDDPERDNEELIFVVVPTIIDQPDFTAGASTPGTTLN